MHIVCLKIAGFPGVRSADIAPGRYVALVDLNNRGETTIIGHWHSAAVATTTRGLHK